MGRFKRRSFKIQGFNTGTPSGSRFSNKLEKSALDPSQQLFYLGVLGDSHRHTCALTPDFRSKLENAFKSVAQSCMITKLEIQKLQGLSAFASQILPIGKLHVHAFAKALKLLPGYLKNGLIPMSQELISDIRWWENGINLSTTANLWNPEPEMTLWTDASNHGPHFLRSSHSRQVVTAGSQLHINCKELLAVIKAVESNLIPKNNVLRVSTDNLPTFFAIKNRGSNRSESLQALSKELYQIPLRKKIQITPYVPGIRNVVSDSLSRNSISPTEGELDMKTFQDLLAHLPWRPQVDAMATHLNSKLPIFISPINHPQATEVDFFSADLNRWIHLYVFLPTNLILKVLMKLKSFRGR